MKLLSVSLRRNSPKQAANEAEATVEAAEGPVVETAEGVPLRVLLTAAGLAAAGTTVAGSAAAAGEGDVGRLLKLLTSLSRLSLRRLKLSSSATTRMTLSSARLP